MVKGLKRSAAHDFSLKLSQTVRRGMQDHARRGGWTGGRPPSGYRRALVNADDSVSVLSRRKAKGERRTLVVAPFEAATVLEILQRLRAWWFRGIASQHRELAERPLGPDARVVQTRCGRHFQGKRTPAGVLSYKCGRRLATGPALCAAPRRPT